MSFSRRLAPIVRWMVSAALSCVGLGAPWAGEAASPVGFSAPSTEAELKREATLARLLSPDSLRHHARILTEEPHVAGTPADRATAEYVLGRLRAYGFDARLAEYPVYLNYPKRITVELTEPGPTSVLATRERGLAQDKDSYAREAFDGFNGYAPSGEAEALVVYANYGDVEDFDKLRELGVEVRGKIALVRYGKIFRGLKARNAEKAGAKGVIIYSDPADDGYAQGEVYPAGPYRPEDAIQRGSVQFLSEGPGDPTTPGWPSKAGGKRLRPEQAAGIPRIPVTPLAYGEASKVLRALAGPVRPAGWQGGLPFPYHLGPGPARIHMKLEMDYAVRPIWNVIATLKGRERPDQWIVCGNHRDAWTYGAIDPNSGTIAMLEMARGIGELAKRGWHPRRSLVLCSWDGEEYGLLGSTEWCEEHAALLQNSCAAYLNVDVAVSGPDFRTNGTHSLRDVLVGVLEEVTDPVRNLSEAQVWRDRLWREGKSGFVRKNRERRWRGEPIRSFEADVSPLGSGSDYTAFVDHLGIPAVDLRFEGPQGSYHSIYDDFEYLDRVVDPGYHLHLTLTEIWARLALRLAEAEVLPLRYARTGQFILDELQSLEERLEEANADRADTAQLVLDWAPLRQAAQRLFERGKDFDARVDASLAGSGVWPGGSAAATDRKIMAVERAFLGGGLPGRPWFRHELYAPGLNTGYAPVPLPGIGQAILDKSQKGLDQGAHSLRGALERAAQMLAP